jgi:tryptophan synthase beta subunit
MFLVLWLLHFCCAPNVTYPLVLENFFLVKDSKPQIPAIIKSTYKDDASYSVINNTQKTFEDAKEDALKFISLQLAPQFYCLGTNDAPKMVIKLFLNRDFEFLVV